LSIVKQIVERLSGKVSFEDADGGGTIFAVDLPLWDGSAGGEIDIDADPAAPRLLFCEDDHRVSRVVRERLRRDGFAVDFAYSVASALARAEANAYGAILVDLQLPDGDGVGLIVRLRAQPRNRDTPIIVLSGDPEPGRTDVRSSSLNVLHWLPKPISFRPLVEALRLAVAPTLQARHRVLHVDDDADTHAMIAELLRPMVEVISAATVEKALQILARERIDLVILDIAIGEDSGIDLLPNLRDSTGKFLPVLIFSNRIEETGSGTQGSTTFSKMSSRLDNLAAAIRERLSIRTEQQTKEVA
jgi:DNA-binding response OmpR family regulator